MGESGRDDIRTIPGPSNREDAVAGPRKNKRKTTKVEKMENTMRVLCETFPTQKEWARKKLEKWRQGGFNRRRGRHNERRKETQSF